MGLYLLVFAVAGLRYRAPLFDDPAKLNRIALLIPAYREDAVIIATVESALNQNYHRADYDVFVIADGLQEDTLRRLKNYSLRVIPVTFLTSTKVKALTAALRFIVGRDYDAVTIVDADNLMDPAFLERANAALCSGYTVIQGCRKAKNDNHPLSRIDGLTEAINSNIFRRGHQELGYPSALTGSGMTFEIDLFEELIDGATAVGGFDKEMELILAARKCPILYDEDAVIYDEKISSHSDMLSQRSRWMGAQWHYARRAFQGRFWNQLKLGNVDYLNKAFQMILPPRVLAVTVQMLMISFLLFGGHIFASCLWAISLMTTVAALAISIPTEQRGVLLTDAIYLPAVLMIYLFGLIKSTGANKRFVHTKHRVNGT